MVYLVLALGFLVGLYAVGRFFLKAKPDQIKVAIWVSTAIFYVFVLLFFAFSGRIIISILLLIPFIMIFAQSYLKKKKGSAHIADNDSNPDQD